jgi:hypothetical protein
MAGADDDHVVVHNEAAIMARLDASRKARTTTLCTMSLSIVGDDRM